jgi:glycosyltransferase involved in cell wall biosynthesis
MNRELRIVVVGQTPPPYGGQATMIKRIIEGSYDGVALYHVRMAFSREMDELGRLSLRKFVLLFVLIADIAWTRLRTGATVLYFPPSHLDRVTIYRDIAVLLSTRWLFRKTVFQFHSGGFSEVYPQLPGWLRWLVRRAYFGADLGIRASEFAPEDPATLQARREEIVPYGIEDAPQELRRRAAVLRTGRPPIILFAAVLRESKGVLVLLDACSRLRRAGVAFELELMGHFASDEFERQVHDEARAGGIDEIVRCLGVLTGEQLNEAFARASVFCFPTFFESEALPIVLLHALQFGLPVVATRWRGIPSEVRDGWNGYLVPIRDAEAVAERLELLLRDPAGAAEMGARGRDLFEESFSLDAFQRRMQAAFDSLR